MEAVDHNMEVRLAELLIRRFSQKAQAGLARPSLTSAGGSVRTGHAAW
jgi:hypothetical protein